MDSLAWPIVIGMLVVLAASGFSSEFLQDFAIPSSSVLMGMWIIWLLATAMDLGLTSQMAFSDFDPHGCVGNFVSISMEIHGDPIRGRWL